MEVRILGPLEVVHTGTPVGLGGSKQRAVFAMLALRVNRVVSMDFLVDGLWESAPPTDPTRPCSHCVRFSTGRQIRRASSLSSGMNRQVQR